jgi:dolichyl-phosphate-mannose--protein O-mannosyl transferase
MTPESGLFLLGISGFIVFYAVLAHLSARMGEGLRLSGYYRLYYIAILILIMAALYGWYRYADEKGSDDMLLILLIAGNVLAVSASYKYWWWLKDELWIKKRRGERSNE